MKWLQSLSNIIQVKPQDLKLILKEAIKSFILWEGGIVGISGFPGTSVTLDKLYGFVVYLFLGFFFKLLRRMTQCCEASKMSCGLRRLTQLFTRMGMSL